MLKFVWVSLLIFGLTVEVGAAIFVPHAEGAWDLAAPNFRYLFDQAIGQDKNHFRSVSDVVYVVPRVADEYCHIGLLVGGGQDLLMLVHFDAHPDNVHCSVVYGGRGSGPYRFRQIGKPSFCYTSYDSKQVDRSRKRDYVDYDVVTYFIPDVGNKRVHKYRYYTHIYDAAGHRLGDERDFVEYIGEGVLQKPLLTAYDRIANHVVVYDDELNSICVFTYLGEYLTTYPLEGARLVDMTIEYASSGEVYVVGVSTSGITRYIKSGGAIAYSSDVAIEGLAHLVYSDEFGLLGLSRTGDVYSIGSNGALFLQCVGGPGARCDAATAYSDRMVVSFDISEESGVRVYELSEAVSSLGSQKAVYYLDIESADVSFIAVTPGAYEVGYLVGASRIAYRSVNVDNPFTLVEEMFELNDLECPATGVFYVTLENVTYTSSEIQMMRGPRLEFDPTTVPAEVCDGETVFLSYDISHPSLTQVSSVTVECRRESDDLLFGGRTITNVPIGENEVRLTLAELGDRDDCGYNVHYRALVDYGGAEITTTVHDDGMLHRVLCCSEGGHGQIPIISGVIAKRARVGVVAFGVMRERVAVYAPSASRVSMYDLRGRKCGELQEETTYSGFSRFGLSTQGLSSGIYFARGNGLGVARLVVLK